MRSITLVLSFLFLSCTLFAQRQLHTLKPKAKKGYRGERWTIDKVLALNLTPSSALDPYGALLQPGLDYYFGEQYSAGLNVGLPLYYVLNNYRDKPKKEVNSDYKLRLDLRQYFRLREHNRLYAGVEIFYRRQQMTLEDSYLRYVDGTCYLYSRVNARKIAFGTGIFIGVDYKLSERLVAGAHIGAGLRMMHMKTDIDLSNAAPMPPPAFNTLLPPNEDRVGDRNFNFYFPFGLKAGFLFLKN